MHRLTDRRHFLMISSAMASSLLLRRTALGREVPDAGISALKDIRVHTEHPLNGEPELPKLLGSPRTKLEYFYIRSHGPTPKLKADDVRLKIDGMVGKPVELSVDQLKGKYDKKSIEATLTCAGNRREEYNAIKKVGGVQWEGGAIGNAQWAGVSLVELLKQAEIKPGAKHVWFEGLDPIPEKDGSSAPFGGSIPLEKALATNATPALVAYEMNEQPLLPEHGFPLRTVVPGFIGARSVKWLTKITVSDRPSPNHFVAEAYKLIQTEEDDLDQKAPLYQYPLNAAICLPAEGAKLKAGKTKIAGYALAQGEPGCTIAKVELSTDGGKTWQSAKLHGGGKPFTWQLWSAEIELPAGKQQLIARATDSKGNVQPEKADWNLKGYMYNAWYRVNVDVA